MIITNGGSMQTSDWTCSDKACFLACSQRNRRNGLLCYDNSEGVDGVDVLVAWGEVSY
jgi:hypothetical protein